MRITVERRSRRSNREIAGQCRDACCKKGQLEQALAETVTLATDNVLLDELLARLSPVPLWPGLLLGASVYRRPVDETALYYWQVGEECPVSLKPEQEQQLQRLMQSFAELNEQGQEITLENLNLPAEELQQALEVYASVQKPPIHVPESIEEASTLLRQPGLLSTVQLSDDTPVAYAVHHWTATTLRHRADPTSLREVHRRAAQHWRWQVKALPQSRRLFMTLLAGCISG
jgi:hypothetical protein